MKIFVIFNGKDPAADNLSVAEAVLRSKTEYEKTALFFGCSEKEPQVRTCLSMGFDDAFVIDCSILQAERALSLFVLERAVPGDEIACGEHCWDDGICPATAGISERTGIEVEEISSAGIVPHTPSIMDIMSAMGKPIGLADTGFVDAPSEIVKIFSLRFAKKCIFYAQDEKGVIALISRLKL